MRRLALALVLIFPLPVLAAGLNDTGITFCGAYSSGNNTPCTGSGPAGQDSRYGRDADAAASKLGGSRKTSGRYNPAIDPKYFPNTPSSYFWSGSPYANHSSSAWYVNFGYGDANYNSRSGDYYVRLMRGGQ